jgi:hypothetical protein
MNPFNYEINSITKLGEKSIIFTRAKRMARPQVMAGDRRYCQGAGDSTDLRMAGIAAGLGFNNNFVV